LCSPLNNTVQAHLYSWQPVTAYLHEKSTYHQILMEKEATKGNWQDQTCSKTLGRTVSL
jgi:hypothetical protein